MRKKQSRREIIKRIANNVDEFDAFNAEDIEIESLEEEFPEELEVEDLDIVDEIYDDEDEFAVADDDEFDDEEEEEDEFELPEDGDDDEILSEDEFDDEFEDEDDEDDEDDDEDDEDVVTGADEGIEKEIGDEAGGGDPSISEVVDSDIDVSTDAEVFPTNSKYVASIVKRLDRVANILEKRGMKKMAYRVDVLSDRLESSIKRNRR